MTYGGFAWLLLFYFILATPHIIVQATTTPDEVSISHSAIMKLNYGLVLKQVDTFDVVTDTWSQSFIIRLPRVNMTAPRVEKADCSLFGGTDQCARLIHLVQYL